MKRAADDSPSEPEAQRRAVAADGADDPAAQRRAVDRSVPAADATGRTVGTASNSTGTTVFVGNLVRHATRNLHARGLCERARALSLSLALGSARGV